MATGGGGGGGALPRGGGVPYVGCRPWHGPLAERRASVHPLATDRRVRPERRVRDAAIVPHRGQALVAGGHQAGRRDRPEPEPALLLSLTGLGVGDEMSVFCFGSCPPALANGGQWLCQDEGQYQVRPTQRRRR